MGESTKAVTSVVLIAGVIAGAIGWFSDRPDAVAWGLRIGGPTLAVLALGLIFKLQFRSDLARDYLREHARKYFNRDGFCFAFGSSKDNGVGYIEAYFQNQHDQPCIGRIALRPARGFLMGRVKIDAVTFEIACAPAAFGVARIAIPISEKVQGKRQAFDVGASVDYPNGKGQRLRFHDGIFLRANTNFGNSLGTTLTIAGAAAGSIVLSKPANATIKLPVGVAEDIPDDLLPEINTLWQLGNPSLDNNIMFLTKEFQ